MNGKPLCLLVMLAVATAGLANAQSEKGPKLYRWVDKQGKVHYVDALPPEAVDQARREFSAETGTATGSVDRALTAEERTQLAAAEKAAAAASAVTNEQKRQEEIMMASYSSEDDMRRAYAERIGLLKVTLESTDISIKNLRENLATMLSQASDTELEGRRVEADRAKMIRELHVEQIKQHGMQGTRRADLQALTGESERMLARYRELSSSRQAPDPAAAVPVTP